MGYSTNFWGKFTMDKPVDFDTYNLLTGLNRTRRMQRDIVKLGMRVYDIDNPTLEDIAQWEKEFGYEGEFWSGDTKDMGQLHTDDVINYNKPPATQPGLWCKWAIQDDRQTIAWDCSESFYHYIEWIEYLIDKILKPRGYKVNGEVYWQAEDHSDAGMLSIINNRVERKSRISFFLSAKDATRVKKLIEDYLSNPLKDILDDKIDREVE